MLSDEDVSTACGPDDRNRILNAEDLRTRYGDWRYRGVMHSVQSSLVRIRLTRKRPPRRGILAEPWPIEMDGGRVMVDTSLQYAYLMVPRGVAEYLRCRRLDFFLRDPLPRNIQTRFIRCAEYGDPRLSITQLQRKSGATLVRLEDSAVDRPTALIELEDGSTSLYILQHTALHTLHYLIEDATIGILLRDPLPPLSDLKPLSRILIGSPAQVGA